MDIVDFRWNTSGQPRAGAAARLAAYFLAALCVVAALCLIVASPAQAKDWRIDSLDVTLDVQPDSRVLVTEKITFTFEGSYSFVGRLIPTGKVDSIGAVEVFRDGTALPVGDGPDSYSTFMEGEYLVVQLNFALADTTATWEIRYVAEGALSYFDDVDELVWRVFDADTPVPIGSVRVTMNLPGSTPSDLLVAAVDTGPDVYNTTSSPGPSMIVFEADDVAPYTHFWIAGGFPKGVVGHPWTYRRVMSFITPRVGFALPIFTLLMMLLVWVRRGRDEPSVVHASFIAEPPSGLSPAMAGALLDEKVEHREVLATLAELARRGYVKLPDATGSKQASAQRLQLLKPAAELRGLEALVVSTIFPGGAVNVTGATIGERLRGLTVPFEEAVFAEIVKAGYFAESPKAARSAWRKRTWWFGLLLAVVTIFLMLEDIGGWGYFFVGAVASVLAMRMFVRRMPQRTAAGAQEQRKWEAFRNYLRDLQRFQDLETARDSFERFLPYAVAFGVERNWARRFEGLSLPAPGWMVPVPVPTSLPSGDVPSPGSVGGPVGAGPVWAPAADTAPAGPSGGGSAPLTLDTLSDRIFGGLDGVTRTLLSAPSSTGSGRGASGGHRSTSSRSSSWSSFGRRSSSRSGGWTSSSRGSSGGSSRGFSGGGGGGGFRAG